MKATKHIVARVVILKHYVVARVMKFARFAFGKMTVKMTMTLAK